MEQGRLFLAISLSFIVIFVWQYFLLPQPDELPGEQQTTGERQADSGTTAEPYGEEIRDPGPADLPEEPALSRADQGKARVITVSSQKYAVRISEKGGAFTSLVLKDYKERTAKDSPLKEMIPPDLPTGTFLTGFVEKSLPGLENARFSADIDTDSTEVYERPRDITFSWRSPEGVVVEKIYRFSPDTYMIGLGVVVKNGSGQTLRDRLSLAMVDALPASETRAYGFEGPSAFINNALEQIKPGDIEENGALGGNVKWAALESRYFLSGVIPTDPTDAGIRLASKNGLMENRYVGPVTNIPPGTQQRFDFDLFVGPKSLSVLKALGNGLDKVVDFGWFDFIAKPCLWLMNFLHDIIPNYGVSIIILTILIKLVLWPLGNKSYQSMSEMKKIQPLMAEIREKYKDDRKRMNEELMNLYRTYKINPAGGCLPMLLQIPVFIALYSMLYQAIELRHAPFIPGWIDDLSAPDRLGNFGFAIPFMEPPYGIPVLTIIMGATMFLQQKMSPPPGDPAQAKIMMFMPVIITFIFINFSAGLVLYWLVNNVLSIAQQYHISKKTT